MASSYKGEGENTVDKDLLKLIAHWERLGWYDRKRICWISFWSCYEIDNRDVISLVAILALIIVMTMEPHQQHKAGLMTAIGLLYFYTILVDYIYKRLYR